MNVFSEAYYIEKATGKFHHVKVMSTPLTSDIYEVKDLKTNRFFKAHSSDLIPDYIYNSPLWKAVNEPLIKARK
jgi:hypothetical protein